MNWQWRSRQGNDRKTNNDAAALISKEQFLFAIIVDAAETTEKGAQLAQFWADETAKKLAVFDMPSCEQVITIMQENQKTLREDFLCEIAAYSALLLHHQTRTAWGFNCGDCCLGIHRSGGVIWQPKPHIRATATGAEFQAQDASHATRHTLTRCLNAKRFSAPDIQQLDWQDGDHWVLASDGYWVDHITQKIPWESLDDDASYMNIAETSFGPQPQHNDDNCFVYLD